MMPSQRVQPFAGWIEMDVEEGPSAGKPPLVPTTQLEWRSSTEPVAYPHALALMEERVNAIRAGRQGELIWLLEHPPLITAGTSAKLDDLLAPERFDVFAAGRGGQYTYHGPGQRIAYCMLDLTRRGKDLRQFVFHLEAWLISALNELGIQGERRAGRVGIWVVTDQGEAKIGAIGVRVRHWISFHGIALNVDPDLTHFDAIVPCGVREHGVTSLANLGVSINYDEIDSLLRRHFERVFHV